MDNLGNSLELPARLLGLRGRLLPPRPGLSLPLLPPRVQQHGLLTVLLQPCVHQGRRQGLLVNPAVRLPVRPPTDDAVCVKHAIAGQPSTQHGHTAAPLTYVLREEHHRCPAIALVAYKSSRPVLVCRDISYDLWPCEDNSIDLQHLPAVGHHPVPSGLHGGCCSAPHEALSLVAALHHPQDALSLGVLQARVKVLHDVSGHEPLVHLRVTRRRLRSRHAVGAHS